jgi:hypothetical protein
MTATNRSDNPGSAQECGEAAEGLAAHQPGRQANQPDPAASPTAQRGAECAGAGLLPRPILGHVRPAGGRR